VQAARRKRLVEDGERFLIERVRPLCGALAF
jgi:hypothetical protein